jgi:hypothetical protein
MLCIFTPPGLTRVNPGPSPFLDPAFMLVNDPDPKPLYYPFQAELTEPFHWDYLEKGPEVWKVRIAKPA